MNATTNLSPSMKQANQIKLLIFDDHIMFREGLVSLFQQQPDFLIVGQGGLVKEAIQLAQEVEYDLILMDFYLPDGTAVDATQAIIAINPAALIVILSFRDDIENVYSAVRNGAIGFLPKNLPVSKLINSLRSVMNGEAAISREMTRKLLQRFTQPVQEKMLGSTFVKFDQLTDRELEVLHELVKDCSNKEISIRLGISLNTVKNHVSNILSKLEQNNRREVASSARNYFSQLIKGNLG